MMKYNLFKNGCAALSNSLKTHKRQTPDIPNRKNYVQTSSKYSKISVLGPPFLKGAKKVLKISVGIFNREFVLNQGILIAEF